jgi:hypothetical protein
MQLWIGDVNTRMSLATLIELGTGQLETTRPEPDESVLAPLLVNRSRTGTSIPRVFALGIEFVAHPGDTEKLQREIPLLVLDANAKFENLCCGMVLFSEHEPRLVTVITLWSERDQAMARNEKRLKRLLEPYVDRWLRTRNYVTFLGPPHLPADRETTA